MDPPQNLIYELPSILEPVRYEDMFAQPRAVEIELGCGDGTFLMDYAAGHPELNLIGVERLLGRIRKIDRKGRRRGLTNLRGVRVDAAYFLRYLVRPASVEALHVYFPDPWPKEKHSARRLINQEFPGVARRVLTPGGRVYLRTDHDAYFEQMRTVFGDAGGFVEGELPAGLLALRTDFEKEFLAAGCRIHRIAYAVG